MERVFKTLLWLLKPLLFPLSLIYGFVMWLRNGVYNKEIYNSIEFSVPVISVGNLSTGGTGKTPHIEYLITLLHYEYNVATMSRGYKRRTSGFRLANPKEDNALTLGDEPTQFLQNFPDIAVSVSADRMAGIPELLRLRPNTEVVLLDDAFQHRSVKPGVNILLMDYKKPFYKDFILPFGRLREARSEYKRADVIIVSKCPENLSDKKKSEIIAHIRPFDYQKVFFTTIKYQPTYDFFTGRQKNITPSTHLVVVTGIARPAPMLKYLRKEVADVHLLKYPDHHYFKPSDLDEIKATIENWQVKDKGILISEKDAARLALHRTEINKWGVPIYILPIQVAFLDHAAEFEHIVANYIHNEQEQTPFQD